MKGVTDREGKNELSSDLVFSLEEMETCTMILKGTVSMPEHWSKADGRIKALSANRSPDSVTNSQRGTPNTMPKRNVIGVTRDYVRQVDIDRITH